MRRTNKRRLEHRESLRTTYAYEGTKKKLLQYKERGERRKIERRRQSLAFIITFTHCESFSARVQQKKVKRRVQEEKEKEERK